MRPNRAVLIGRNTLLVDCAQVLLDRGWEIAGVVAPTPPARDWASRNGIAAVDFTDLTAFLADLEPFDYLFSITNLRMLPPDVLALPRRMAINFHDAPLPRGAGMHATAWAIAEQAHDHGVSWHVMVEEADAGDILAARAVEIGAEDTSHDLNVACHQAGLASFTELVEDLAAGRARRTVQDRSRRTYHPRWARPDAALTISWGQPPEAIAALVRATAFGPHPNEFGTAKLLVGQELSTVDDAVVCSERSGEQAGTILEVTDNGIKVATVGADLWLRGLSTAVRHRGERLADPTPDQARALTQAYDRALRHERFWVERLRESAPLDVPLRAHTGQTGLHRLTTEPPAWVSTSDNPAETMFAAVLAFLARLSDSGPFDVAVRHRQPSGIAASLLAAYVPFRTPELPASLADLLDEVGWELRRVRHRDTHATDLPSRYPDLRASGAHTWPVAVDLCPDEPTDSAAPLQVFIAADATVTWQLAAAVTPADTATALRAAFGTFVDGFAEHGPRTAPLVSPAAHPRDCDTTDYPADRCVSQLVAERARATPHATAVTCTENVLSYRELDERATMLARSLAQTGVKPGDRVAVHLSRSVDLPVALLAVMRTGAAYVPLDPIYPPDRVHLMLADADVRLVLTESALAADLPATAAPIVELDALVPRLVHRGGGEPFDLATPDGVAYVIYTSGSTGRPKGVRVGHKALTNFLCSMARRPGFGPGDRMLAVTTVCFDIAGLELYLPLITGGHVEIAPAEVAADGVALRGLIEEAEPTVMQATPATWQMLLAAGWTGHPGLRVLCGGEVFPPDLAETLCARTGQVWNLYGPTETTIWSAVSEVRPGAPISLGEPIANTTLHVLDSRGNPMPDGVPGELCIGGHGLAHGYHERADLTAERFPTLPTGERVYRTGDLVRHRLTGGLEYLGRLDHQVKIRGYRVELGEIEACLSNHPHVARAVVVARDHLLLGYLVPAPGHTISTADLREHAARTLPDYMVPTALVTLAAFPLTPNGKVDRRALPEPALGGPPSRPPRTSLERTLCELFRGVVGVDEVGVDDRFVDLGGTSVSAAALVGRARANGLRLDARTLFDHPTPARLAAALDGATATDPAVDLAAEIHLADDITPAAEVVRVAGEPGRILLTGATGFVGAFLLRELTGIPGANVHCLIRAQDPAHARDRLLATLARYELAVDLAQVTVEVADLAAPELGLAPGRFDELARDVDVVYHAGAVVNWLHSYADLKPVNVTGTEQILRLAARHRTVPVHYVSSMGVFAHRAAGSPRHRHDDPIGPAEELITGYQRSKWVTEHLIALARDRGLPVSIYRVARVCGDRDTGACQSDDLLWRVLKGSIQVGGVPVDTDLRFDLVPADHVAAALTWLSRHQDHASTTHHLANPHLTTFATMVDALRTAGHPLLDLDRDKWCDLIDADPGNAAHALLHSFRTTAWHRERTEVPLDPTATQRALASSGLDCPPIDTELLVRHQEHFVRTGFLPEPEGRPSS